MIDNLLGFLNTDLSNISQVEFLGVKFHRMPREVALEILLAMIETKESYSVYFVNAHTIEIAQHNLSLQEALQRSSLILADGSGILWGSKVIGTPLTFNLNGTDLIPALCAAGGQKKPGISVYFLGAQEEVVKLAAENIAMLSPGIKIAGYRNGYFSEEEIEGILADVRQAKPDILLVGMGTPLQEIWIDRHSSKLPGITCFGVGGLFDFISGKVPRAPYWIRKIGFEWLWRLMIEPKRLWKRYTVGNIIYLRALVHSFVQKQKQKLS
ncbi:MAG: WecB/TagA/CpsF family glycosyltransferase [Microcoleaceae cyanobacterium MO_207.B10]|nr:WecB/TagA/CpsF family glycosyltransferase [Microcoleaceae cyanobacterium MO_207.B10]